MKYANLSYAVSFIFQAAILLLIDAPAVVPNNILPKQFLEMRNSLILFVDGPLCLTPPFWVQSLIWSQMLIDLPILLVLSYQLIRNRYSFMRWLGVYLGRVATVSLIFGGEILSKGKSFRHTCMLLIFYFFPLFVVLKLFATSLEVQILKKCQ